MCVFQRRCERSLDGMIHSIGCSCLIALWTEVLCFRQTQFTSAWWILSTSGKARVASSIWLPPVISRPSLHLARDCLRWTGHALRSDDTGHSEVLQFVPEGGRRRIGRPRLRYYDTLKADLSARGVIVNARKQEDFWRVVTRLAADRKKWRNDIMENLPELIETLGKITLASYVFIYYILHNPELQLLHL